MIQERSSLIPAALAGALIALVVLLAGNLGALVLPAGIPLIDEAAPGSEAPETANYGARTLRSPFDMFQVLIPLAMLFVIYGAVESVRSRTLRREFGISLVALAVLTVTYLLASFLYRQPHSVSIEGALVPPAASATAERPADSSEAALELPALREDAPESRWHLYVSFALVCVLLAGGAGILLRRILSRRSKTNRPAELEQLLETLNQAADRLRAGDDAHGVVRTCYARMVDLLSGKSNVSPVNLTPREFLASLRSLGLGSDPVDELTSIFEDVRYGARSDASFADRALRCLDAIRLAHEELLEAKT